MRFLLHLFFLNVLSSHSNPSRKCVKIDTSEVGSIGRVCGAFGASTKCIVESRVLTSDIVVAM